MVTRLTMVIIEIVKIYHNGHGDGLGDHDEDLDDDDQAGVWFAVAVCCNCEQMSRALRVS